MLVSLRHLCQPPLLLLVAGSAAGIPSGWCGSPSGSDGCPHSCVAETLTICIASVAAAGSGPDFTVTTETRSGTAKTICISSYWTLAFGKERFSLFG